MRETALKILPSAGMSIKWRITLPFVFLALIMGLGATLIVNQILNESSQERFWRQVADSGKQAADAIVRREMDLLEVGRLIANTEGVLDSAALADAEGIRERVLPLVINADLSVAVLIDTEGHSILTIRKRPDQPAGTYERPIRGENYYAEWPFVQRVLAGEMDEQGDKFSGIASIFFEDEEVYTFFLAGPLRNSAGEIVGAVLVGSYLDDIITEVTAAAGANISLYRIPDGYRLSSTLEFSAEDEQRLPSGMVEDITSSAAQMSSARLISVAGSTYGEVLTPMLFRGATETGGIIGTSILAAPFESAVRDNVYQVARTGAIALLVIIAIGLIVAQLISHPLVKLSEVMQRIAQGDTTVEIPAGGSSEVSMIAHSAIRIKESIRSGSYPAAMHTEQDGSVVQSSNGRDYTLSAASRTSSATILTVGLKMLSKRLGPKDPKRTFADLNELYPAFLTILQNHGGMPVGIDGNSLSGHFGVLPRSLRPQVSSLQATHAAMEILEFVNSWNRRRAEQGLWTQDIGVGVATGEIIAGIIGIPEEKKQIVLGDPVKIALQIEQATHALHGNTLLICENTYRALASAQQHFEFGRFGKISPQGTGELNIYEIRDRSTRLLDRTAEVK